MSSPSDLTTLADCKAWLGLASAVDDALLAGLITAVSRAILADIGRAVAPSTYLDTIDGGGGSTLPLRNWPVTELLGCAIDGIGVPLSQGAAQPGVALDLADPSPPGAMQRIVYRGGMFRRGLQNIAVSYRAGYEIVAEAANVPASAPYAVVAASPFGPWTADTGQAVGYTVEAGTYAFPPAAAGSAVALSYAYVPADLAQAACEWVADRYLARSRIGQASKTLGGQETTSFIVKAMPDVVARLLAPYRRVVG